MRAVSFESAESYSRSSLTLAFPPLTSPGGIIEIMAASNVEEAESQKGIE